MYFLRIALPLPNFDVSKLESLSEVRVYDCIEQGGEWVHTALRLPREAEVGWLLLMHILAL